MNSIPHKVVERLNAGIKKFQPILAAAKSRDDNESDTVKIIIEMLADIFGYDKFAEIKMEHAIKGTFCDLAIKFGDHDKPCLLIEAKAINIELKDSHVNQAVGYAAREGIEWVVLTNGIHWRIYKVVFGQPVDQELVIDFDFSLLSRGDERQLETLYQISKEGFVRCSLEDYHLHIQALSRFSLAATVVSKPVLEIIRRELRRISPNTKITTEEINDALRREVLKGEVVEGAKAEEARKRIAKAQNKASHKNSKDPSTIAKSDPQSAVCSSQGTMTPEQERLQPTLQDRLAHPLRTSEEAARQRQEHREMAQQHRSAQVPPAQTPPDA